MDDLANQWGTQLCLPERHKRSLFSPRLPRSNLAVGGAGGTTPTSLPVLVSAETNLFTFGTVLASGSQANNWSIDDATNGNASLCLFAAGSYVAGDATSLQQYSTSKFVLTADLCHITPPEEASTPACRENTIPLPYHIPGALTPDQLQVYEDECLQKVHIQLCWAKMRNKSYKALFLELILAGNGATLSNRALISIGKLAGYHQLRVIVDEIMTGGRTGSMIYLLTKPPSFQAVVTHITFGKWSRMGIVLLSKTWAEKRDKLYPFIKRGASGVLCEDEAVLQWRCLKSCLHEIPAKRAAVLTKLKLTEAQVWGAGLLLFGPKRITSPRRGLKCRYLPLIHKNTPIDSVRVTMAAPPNDFRKAANQAILKVTRQWILDVPQPVLDPQGLAPVEQKRMNAARSSDFAFVAKLIKGSKDLDAKPSEEWRILCMPKDCNRSQVEGALASLRSAGYVVQTQVGNKRKRHWQLKEGFIAPWKSEDFDAIVLG